MNRLRKREFRFSAFYLLAALLALYIFQVLIATPQTRKVSYTDFIAEVRAGHLAEVNITSTELIGLLKEDAAKQKQARVISATRLPGIDESPLVKELEAQAVKLTGTIQVRSWWTEFLISWLLPLALLFAFYGYGMWRVGQGPGAALSFGKNRAKIYDESSKINATFADVAGVDEAKAELVEIVDFLKNPQKYQKLGGRIPKGLLLVGPPGTGKTLLAKAVAGEASVPFFSISGSEFVEMFVGVGAARVRDLFEQARAKAPCIIFIDELDALGRARGTMPGLGGHDEKEQTLNQLLVELDGFDPASGIVLIAATNRPEILDPALLRAGRFDRQVLVDRPDRVGRQQILKVHTRKIVLATDVKLEDVAALTPGFTGADLANLVNEAALVATRGGADRITMNDFNVAIERIVAGLEKKNRLLNPREREIVAHHEMGHAFVAAALPGTDAVHKISIIPRGIGALGYTIQRPTEDRYLMTKEELENKMAVLLGGRAAEHVVFGHLSTGAADDLSKATDIARNMVTRFGMGRPLGPVTYESEPNTFLGPMAGTTRLYAEETAREIDVAVREIVDAAFERARAVLTRNRPILEEGAKALLAKETLGDAELSAVLEKVIGEEPRIAAAAAM